MRLGLNGNVFYDTDVDTEKGVVVMVIEPTVAGHRVTGDIEATTEQLAACVDMLIKKLKTARAMDEAMNASVLKVN